MSRPSLRRTPNLESLETRQVLSSVVGPTPDQQYALELINLVRTNPSAAADEITANLTPDVQATLNQYGLTGRRPQGRDGLGHAPAAARLERFARRLGPAAEPV